MSLNIDNKVYRNMQEQVCANARNISKIKDFLDGLDVEDTVIVLESLSSLNSEQMKVAEQPLAFIVYDEAIYLKTKEDATYFYFERMVKMELGSYITLSSAVIQVTKLNGATGITVSSVNVYSKSQIDTSLGLKADVTYVDNQLDKKANLSGANFTGNITAPSIIENMSGYSFTKDTTVDWSPVYVGACKNGNKLSLVIFGRYTRLSGDSNSPLIGSFTIPSAVGAKLYPYSIGGANYKLDQKLISFFADNFTNVSVICDTNKASNTSLEMRLRGLSSLTENTEYVFRYEVTFLLSENLAV